MPLVSRSGSGWNQLSNRPNDMNRLMDTMVESGTVFGIVDRIATGVAGSCWKLYQKAASGLKEDRKQITSHGVLDLLADPNPFMSLNEMHELGQQHSELVGETNIVVGRAKGVKYPIELWPCMPQRLTPEPDPYAYLKGWIYQGPDGDRVPIELNEILRHRRPNPRDPYRGVSWVQSILTDLDADRFGQEWQRQFYLNSAQPGGIIEMDRRLDDDEFDEMTLRWREQHQGVNKAHRIAIIENGGKYVSTPLTHADMQFAEMSPVIRDRILVAAGFPKAALGITEDVNRANAEAGEYLFAKWLVKTRLDRWKGMYDMQLLPMFFGVERARGYELDYDDPVPENSATAMVELTTKVDALIDLTSRGFDVTKVAEFLSLPDLGYTAPPPPTSVTIEEARRQDVESGFLPEDKYSGGAIEDARKWEAVEMIDDDHVCDPCRENHGKTYKNRAAAYKDYPGGEGFVDCIGAKFGNKCRGKVVKRGKS